MSIKPLPGVLALTAILCASLLPAGAQHWAFQPPVRHQPPRVRQDARVRNVVDAFVLKGLEQRGLSPSPPADRPTLLRRMTFDLTGLPPTPAEIAQFVSDRSPDYYEKTVQRLLASPHFGERWAQHWLDVVRFAESNGYEHDLDRMQAWRYRDWVVDALNADKPYDRFLQEQIAGDLIAPEDFQMRVATGFLRAGPFHITGGNLDPKEMRQEWLTEAVASIGTGILGLTVACARCHDHKFDPIPQADYYRLQACFAATANRDVGSASDTQKRDFESTSRSIKERIKPIDAEIARIEQPCRERLREQKRQRLAPEVREALGVEPAKRTAAQKRLASEAGALLNISWDEVVNALSAGDRIRRSALRSEVFALERELPAPLPAAEGVADNPAQIEPMRLLLRGDVHTPGPEVSPGFPACLAAASSAAIGSAHPRLDLARWITTPENPLTARVLVNRVWSYLFGHGLVATPNDFGRHGTPPSSPGLLDWLAVTFVSPSAAGHATQPDGVSGCAWHLKALIALLVTSSAYRQACDYDFAKAASDPENILLWRMNRKRLDAESIRDATLACAGTLNVELHGPSIRVPLEPEVYETIFTESEPDNLWPAAQDPKQHTRRSLYLFRKRNVRLPLLTVFDQPDMMSSCAARGQTVHALQALALMNGEFMRDQSRAMARRLLSDCPSGGRKRIDRLFLLTLNRLPRSAELQATLRFLKDQKSILRAHAARKAAGSDRLPGVDPVSFRALADLCLATFNRNDFLYVR